jgi:hypothetical protein
MELEIKDPYLRRASSFPKPPLGLVLEDIISKFPGPEICRTRDTSIPVLVEIFRRDPQQILCRGAAVGLDAGGICRHAQPGLKGFIGFAEKNLDQGRVAVVTQGAFEISIPGLSSKEVYCTGQDSFNSEGKGFLVGKILYQNPERPNKVMCVFQRHDSPKKMILDFSAHTAKFL